MELEELHLLQFLSKLMRLHYPLYIFNCNLFLTQFHHEFLANAELNVFLHNLDEWHVPYLQI